jgi:hypothetical protein
MKQNIASGINLEDKDQKPSISNIDLRGDLQSITFEDLVPQLREKEYQFSVVPKDIMYMRNGIRYYYIEIQCYEGNFIINAHGSEAERLFKAVHSISE